MRPKVVFIIFLVAVGLLAGIALVSKALRPQSAPATSSADNGNVAPAPAVASQPVMVPAIEPPPVVSAAPVANTNAVADTNAAAAHEKYVRRRVQELNTLSWNNDVESRDAILAELKTNSDKTIWAAALEAAVQFDDRSVVPPMQEIAAQTQDPVEKAKILEAIDYINLPSLSEFLADHPGTPGAALGKVHPHGHARTQSPDQSPDQSSGGSQ